MAIGLHVLSDGSDYSDWTVGLTHRPHARRLEHGNPQTWFQWNVNTEQVARRIEADLIDRGMNGGTGGAGWRYVYIFLD